MNTYLRALRAALLFTIFASSFAVAQTAYEEVLAENPVVLRAGMHEETFADLDWRFSVVIAGVLSSQGMPYNAELRAQFDSLFPVYLEQRAEEVALIKAAYARDITVDEAEIDELIAGLVQSAGADYPIEYMLADSGLENLEQLRTLMIEANYIDGLIGEIAEGITIDDAAIALHYRNNKEAYRTPALYCASHILVADEALAQRIIDDVNDGVSFAELAAEHGTDGTASRGGDLGCFGLGQMVPAFEQAVIDAPVGEASGPVESNFGYHAILVQFADHGGIADLEAVHDRIVDELIGARVNIALQNIYQFSGVVTYPEAIAALTETE